MNILLIGAGNMGQAIIGGIVSKKLINPADIYIFEINAETREDVIRKYEVRAYNEIDSSIADFDFIIFAVKPQVFNNFQKDPVMKKITENLSKDQLVVSIMAGITIKNISAFLNKGNPIVRVMPNTPALVSQSMSVLAPSNNTSDDQLKKVINIFEAIGKVEILEEELIDAVTGLSGSGPAYVFTFIEALIQGGILCGLSKTVAEKLAVQTVLGAALMIDENNKPEELRNRVTSPGGTTIEGLSVLERKGFREAIIEAIRAATERSKELSLTD